MFGDEKNRIVCPGCDGVRQVLVCCGTNGIRADFDELVELSEEWESLLCDLEFADEIPCVDCVEELLRGV